MEVRDWFRFERWAGRLSGRPRQLLVLTRHFFNRFFQNDVFTFEEQMKEKLYVLLAMVAPMGWFMCSALFLPYLFAPDNGESWSGKFVFIAFFMTLLAIAVVLEWDVLFLDRRDELNFVPLPIRMGTIFTAKFLASFVFVAFFSAAVNALSVVAVSMFLTRWIGGDLDSLLRYGLAHIVSTTAAFVFVFLFFVFLESVLLVLFRGWLFRAVSLAVRFALAVGGIIAVFSLLNPSSLLATLAELHEGRITDLLWFPPMWFTSIYEIMIGRGKPLYAAGANIGLAAILILALAFFAGLALSYRTHVRQSLEIRTRRRPLAVGFRFLSALFDRIFLPNPTQRAVFHFTSKTLRQSPAHKVRLAGYLAVTLGFLWILLGGRKDIFQSAAGAGLNVYAAPLLLAFALLLGVRSGMNTPLAAEANWVFRMTETVIQRPYFLALKKAVFFLILFPLFAVLFAVHAWFWGVGPAAVHGLYGLTWALLARELLFWRFARIPFSCLVVPGKARLYSRWLPYLLGALLAFSALSSLERALWRSSGGFPIFFGAMAVVLFGLNLVQRLFVYEKLKIVYEEEPEPVMVTL
jgi:hypothetical protein